MIWSRIGAVLAASAAALCGGYWIAQGARAGDADLAAFPGWLAQRLPEQDAELRRFYAERGHQLAWIDRDSGSARARDLVRALESAPDHGLDAEAYSASALRRRVEADGLSREQRFALELELSRAFAKYAAHLARGRVDPKALGIAWDASGHDVDLPGALAIAAGGDPDRAIATLAPADPRYRALREALGRYRKIAAEGGWRPLGAGAVLTPGHAAPATRIEALTERLAREGYLDRAGRSSPGARRKLVYNERLAAAVALFQKQRGIEDDGIVGPDTLRELDVPAAARVRQIELNLERWRWLPHPAQPRELRVNVPSYELRLVEHGQNDLVMRVIVGDAASESPMLADRVETIVLNPYWNVPESIAREEILPAIQKDPTWIARNQLEIVSGPGDEAELIDPATVDWDSLDSAEFPYRIRQRPGPHNALGQIEFLFPNHFSVYLHATPEGELFDNTERALSHGCIRVERPRELADRLLARNPEWGADRIDAALAAGERVAIKLQDPVPVYLLYETAFVNGAGRVEFHQDIYEIDARLAEALGGRVAVSRAR